MRMYPTSSAFFMVINRNLTGLKAIEYNRKSTEDEERQIASLEDQHAENQKVIERHQLKVAKNDIIEESKSAKKPGRPKFNKMVEDIANGKFQVIVCWQANRLARNSRDAGEIIGLLSDKKLIAIVTPGKIYFNGGEDKLLLYIEFGMSEKYSDDLSANVIRGMTSKVGRGWWPGRPKVGYVNIKYDGEEPVQIVDEQRFPLLRRAIDLFLDGNHTAPRVLEILNDEWGFKMRKTKRTGGGKMSKGKFYSFLTDPFYYGKLVWGKEIGDVHKSLKRLMSEDEFWKIQALLGKRGQARPSVHTKLPFRGLIKCGECQSTWIPYVRPRQMVDSSLRLYEYIRCNHDGINKKCTQKQVTIQEIEKQVLELLDQITISEDFCNWAIDWIKKQHQTETNEQLQILKNLENSLEQIQGRKNKLVEMYMDSLLDGQADYKKRKADLEKEEQDIQKELNALKARTNNWMDLAIKTFNFAKNAKYHFEHGTFEDKTLILRTLGSNFYMLNGKLCVDLIKPFFIFKNNRDLVNVPFETIENPEYAMVGASNGDFEHWFLKWSG